MARFLCFWGRYPRSAISRKFVREGAAVSSSAAEESDPPLPFARRSGKADRAAGLCHGEARKRYAAAFRRGTRGGAGRRDKVLLYMRVRRTCPFARIANNAKTTAFVILLFGPKRGMYVSRAGKGEGRRPEPPPRAGKAAGHKEEAP